MTKSKQKWLEITIGFRTKKTKDELIMAIIKNTPEQIRYLEVKEKKEIK